MKKSALILVLAAGVANAQTNRDLFAINNLAFDTNDNNSLIQFNPTTLPSFNTIGATGLSGVGAADFTGFNPVNGSPLTIYAQDTFGTSGGGLFEIDVNTGAATFIGTPSVAMDDFAYNPTDGLMYGIQGADLYTIDLDTAVSSFVGTFSDISGALSTGLGVASDGRVFIQDLINDAIYVAQPGSFDTTLLYNIPFDANFSQGLFVDWSNGDRGYYGALNNTSFDGELWEFDIDGGGLDFISNFGPLDPDGLPPVETGDLFATPVPAPSALALLGLGGLALRRRR